MEGSSGKASHAFHFFAASHGSGALAAEGGKGTPRSVMSDQTDVQGQAPVDMDRGDRGADIGCVSHPNISAEEENRMLLLCQAQMQSRLQDVRFYLSSRIRHGGVSKESRMELLEVLCLVDPDFDYQEFGLVESTAVSDSLELVRPRDSIGTNSFLSVLATISRTIVVPNCDCASSTGI